MLKELQSSILGGFWDPLGALWGPFLSMLEGLWLFLGILWVQNGARSIKMRVYLAQIEGPGGLRGSQCSTLRRFSSSSFVACCLASLCVCLAKKVLCIHFGTLTWSFGVFSFMSAFQHGILTWLQRRIAFCSCFSKSVLDVVKAAPQARPKTT